ncbi:hypothetical protein V6N13_065803 [Hibiscus sabdariffa]
MMKTKMKEMELEQMETTNIIPFCHCGVLAALRISWTKDNSATIVVGWLTELFLVLNIHLTTLTGGDCVEALWW